MQYLFKNGSSYIYKRRIPLTNKFYTFSLGTKNVKKAKKIIKKFNRLSFALFNYLKYKAKDSEVNLSEVYEILDKYRQEALVEYSKLETDRHTDLGKLFKTYTEDPLFGKTLLDGSSPEVIQKALTTFKNLANGSMYDNRKNIKKLGKDIVKRSIPDVKQVYSSLRSKEDELLKFLVMLIKSEAEILKSDYERSQIRFNTEYKNTTNVKQNNETNRSSYTEELKNKHKRLKDIVEDFLLDYCKYKQSDLTNSKSQGYKTNKILEFFLDYCKSKNIIILNELNSQVIKDTYNLIVDIPKKKGNITQSYKYFDKYLEFKDSDYEKRGISTIKIDLQNFHRFIKYLKRNEKYISSEEFDDYEVEYENVNKSLSKAVKNEEIKDSKNVQAFSNDMLKCLFNPKNRPYNIVIDTLLGRKKLRKGQNIEDFWARFYVPLIMFFSGARPSEISFVKVKDCEIKEFEDNKERVILFVEANEERSLKTKTSRRIIVLHDFLCQELGFIKFLQKAIKEKREYLFNTNRNVSEFVSKEFLRDKSCMENFYTREEKFNNVKHNFHSFRHTFKTYLVVNKKCDKETVDKMQGHTIEKQKSSYRYLSATTKDMVSILNDFDLYKIIDWSEFEKVAKRI